MSVPVGVIALAEDAPVLLRGEVGVVVIVRGGEFSFAGEIEQALSAARVRVVYSIIS